MKRMSNPHKGSNRVIRSVKRIVFLGEYKDSDKETKELSINID